MLFGWVRQYECTVGMGLIPVLMGPCKCPVKGNNLLEAISVLTISFSSLPDWIWSAFPVRHQAIKTIPLQRSLLIWGPRQPFVFIALSMSAHSVITWSVDEIFSAAILEEVKCWKWRLEIGMLSSKWPSAFHKIVRFSKEPALLMGVGG